MCMPVINIGELKRWSVRQGHGAQPYIPHYEGHERFEGLQLHSADYENAEAI